MAETWQRWRGRKSASPATPRGNARSVFRTARATPGATVPRSPSPGFPGRCVDPTQSGDPDSRPLRDLVPSSPCQPHPEGLRVEQPEANTPSEPEKRDNHPAMEGRALAPDQKKAVAEGRTLVFADQSGFYLLPGKVRTYAPVGQTPIIRAPLSRDHLSAMGGITPEGKLYLMVQERAYRGGGVPEASGRPCYW